MNTESLLSKDSNSATPGLREPSGRVQTGWLAMWLGLLSAFMLWLAFPPVGWWPLAWLAPVPMIVLIRLYQPRFSGRETSHRLPAEQPLAVNVDTAPRRILKGHFWRQLYLVGLVYWLATFYFIPIPHPALWLGWMTVSAYMAIYTPLFVLISQAMVFRFGIPLIVAAPVTWTGLEWFRCNFATGMAMACLSHTQYQQPILIQIADLSGAYTVTFAIVIFAAGVSILLLSIFGKYFSNDPHENVKAASSSTLLDQHGGKIWSGALTSILVLGAVVGYGYWRIENLELETKSDESESIQVAIVQSSIDVVLRPPTMEEQTEQFKQYRDLTLAARQQWPDLDLILWPESSFPVGDLVSDLNEQQNVAEFAAAISDIWQNVTGHPFQHSDPVHLLAGATTHDPLNEGMYNSAILISDPGIVSERYYKIHRVMLGEYVPFADWFPVLQRITPIGRGLTAGREFKSIEIEGIRLTPSICFETTMPHLIRRQINTLASAPDNQEPDAIVNLTNDGWFFGTSCLDLHLACNVFRAVEMRKPNLVCANTGFSAEIDATGRLVQVGPRRDVGLLKAEVKRSRIDSTYRVIGDSLPKTFGFVCIGVWVMVWMRQYRIRNKR